MLKIQDKPWWERDVYDRDMVITPELEALAGPNQVALVRAYESGQTQRGWGLTDEDGNETFMPKYQAGDFLPRRTTYGYDAGKHASALVMRSVRAVAVDIDGKNGGLDHVRQLGNLPYSGAEISKSGNGYHILYDTGEEWDPAKGYGAIADQIGIVQGVDIRGVGCLYHHNTQRWNNRPIVRAPDWLMDRLRERTLKREQGANKIKDVLASYDMEEIILMQSNLLDELQKPIPAGRRNNTLFALASQLKQGEVPNWQEAVINRATQLKLSQTEAEKIVQNAERYG